MRAPSPIRWLTALVAGFGPLIYAAHLGAVAALALLAVVATLATGRPRWRDMGRDFAGFTWFLPLMIWLAFSAAWALDGAAALGLALRLGLIWLAGALLWRGIDRLPAAARDHLLLALTAGLTGAALLVTLDLAAGGVVSLALHRFHAADYPPALFYGQGATIHAILLGPLSFGLWRAGHRRLALAQAVIAILCVLSTVNLSAKTALVAGAAGFAVIWLLPRLRWFLLGLLALAVASAPFATPLIRLDPATTCWLAAHKPSALHRIYIWRFVAGNIAERPILGWGLDAARRLPGGHQPVAIHACDAALAPTGKLVLESEILPLHPHNAILQIWLELGGIGAALSFGAVILALGHALRAGGRIELAVMASGIIAALSVTLVSFGIWQEWLDSSLIIAAVLMRAVTRPPRPAPGQSF